VIVEVQLRSPFIETTEATLVLKPKQ